MGPGGDRNWGVADLEILLDAAGLEEEEAEEGGRGWLGEVRPGKAEGQE